MAAYRIVVAGVVSGGRSTTVPGHSRKPLLRRASLLKSCISTVAAFKYFLCVLVAGLFVFADRPCIYFQRAQ